MRDEYDIKGLNPRENPYTGQLTEPVTIMLDHHTIDYFHSMAADEGIPYQTLIRLYLKDCADRGRKIQPSGQ